jgi:hypothetical protein
MTDTDGCVVGATTPAWDAAEKAAAQMPIQPKILSFSSFMTCPPLYAIGIVTGRSPLS